MTEFWESGPPWEREPAGKSDLVDIAGEIRVRTEKAIQFYYKEGVRYTFWLLTRGDRFVKGEGLTDASALDQARRAALEHEERA